MSQKKIKTSKSQQKAKENKYFFGALIGIGALLVLGVAFAAIIGTGGTGTAVNGSGAAGGIAGEIEKKYGDSWREMGFVEWEYSSSMTMFYVDRNKLPSDYDELVKAVDKVGDQLKELVEEQGVDPKSLNVMIHDNAARNMMLGTYSGVSGAQIQK